MGDPVKLHEDPHDRAQKLLPWYANKTLEPAEAALVEAHLATCADCRAALEMDRALGRQALDLPLPLDVEKGWAAMRERLVAIPDRPGARVPFLRRPIAIGWAITAQALAAALIFVLVLPSHPPTADPAYHALGAVPAGDAGNIVVLFGPRTTQADMHSALTLANAHVVGGPTASGAYVVKVPEATRADALKQLRTASGVVLAEPIDRGDPS